MTRSTLILLLLSAGPQAFAAETTPYSHGDPSADEQYVLELINRARANPTAEGLFLAKSGDFNVEAGINFFNVNRTRLKADFAGYAARPPLAFNPKLLASARRQSKDMATNNFQDHIGSDGSTISDRVSDEGYDAASVSENIYSSLVATPLFAHAGLNIDWGFGVNGVQPDLGHRLAIMGAGVRDYQEIGISIVSRYGKDAEEFGKLCVTQDFGNRFDSPNFLVGVAYYDVNGNGICDPGEGLPGIKVKPATGSWHAVTSSSGGYAIPFPKDPGADTVTFNGGGLKVPVDMDFTLRGGNAKLDLRITSGEPFVSVKPVDNLASEKGGSARFQVERVGPYNKSLTVILNGPARSGVGIASPDDYTFLAAWPATVKKSAIVPGQFFVTIPSKWSFAEVKLLAVNDKQTEPAEQAVFTIGGSSAYRTSIPKSVKILIKP